MRWAVLVFACLVSAVPAFAQVPDQSVFVRNQWNGVPFAGEAERGAFTEKVICAFQPSAVWKHLRKFGGQNNHNGHAVDAILHVPTGYAVDIATDLQPIWLRDSQPLYADPKFVMEPINCEPTPTPTPDPPPTPPVDLSKIYALIDTLQASVDALNMRLAELSVKLAAEEAARIKDVTDLKARPVYTRCRVPLFGCRLE